MTKFEKDLQQYFPEIYELHLLGKKDPFIWLVIEAMLELSQPGSYGKIEVNYQEGKINKVFKTLQQNAMLSNKPSKMVKRQKLTSK